MSDYDKEAIIFEDKDSNLKVVPDYLFVKKKEGFKIKFRTINSKVKIVIPELEFVEIKEDGCIEKNSKETFFLDVGEKKILKLNSIEGIDHREYPYAIYSINTSHFLLAKSPPSMIIDPDI